MTPDFYAEGYMAHDAGRPLEDAERIEVDGERKKARALRQWRQGWRDAEADARSEAKAVAWRAARDPGKGRRVA